MTVLLARAGLALALATALGGCATLAPQPRGDDITPLLEARGGPAVDWAAQAGRAGDEAIAPLLAKPMTLDAALRVAMLRSPRLQQEYARLGLARAEVIEAVQVENPRISFSRLSLDSGGEKRATGVSLPLLDLLVLPMRARLANVEYERARLEIASAVLGVVAEVEAAWYEHVAATQVAAMRAAAADGADASAELAQRFFDAGNISELQLRQEQAVASEARIDALRARAEAGRKALALHSLLGLRGEETAWQASVTLPLPVPEEDAPELLANLAREGNLELMAARQEAEVLADALGITRRLRWLGGSEIGYEREKEADGERLRGPSISLELPVFNQGQGRLARAEAQLAGALARVAQAELSSEHAVRQGAETVAVLRRIVATHRESLVPQREAIVARQQERQNFMLIGVFELIQAKVAEYDAYQAYLEAVRDYWLARVGLARAVGQRLPSDAGIGERTPGVQDILAPPAAGGHEGMDHSGHDMPKPEPEPEKTEAKEEDEHAHHHGATP